MTIRRTIARGLPLGPLLLMPAMAAAQTAAPATPSASDTPAPPEIVVTATRQNTTLSRVPAAVTAITAREMAPGGVTDVADLQNVVPNVSIGNQSGTNRTFIRGVGLTNSDVGGEGAVAFLQNGAIITRPAAQLQGFFDLSQIEVLRGPQSILYGRGATAGAINLVTKLPTDQFDGYVRASYGNYDATTVEGAIGGPIVNDRVMIRLAGKYEYRDGYGTNLYTNTPVDNRNAYSLRGTIVAKLSDTVKATIVVDHTHENDNNYEMHFLGTSIVPLGSLPNTLAGGETIYGYYAARGESPNLRNTYSNGGRNYRYGTGATATIDWSDGALDIKSISAYRQFYRYNLDDSDTSSANFGGQTVYAEDSKSASQEFVGTYQGNGFTLLGGAMYLHERLEGGDTIALTNTGLLFGLPADTFDNGVYEQNGVVEINAYGVYLQGAVDLTSTLKLTAGARYNYEHRSGTGFFRFDLTGTDVATDAAKGWGSLTPKVLLEYHPSAATMLYASVTKGFKSGVINVGSTNPVINPETVWSYEAGFKQHLFNNRLQLNGSAFYYDYKNLQVTFISAAGLVETVNAASARNYGAELELQGHVTKQFQISATASYLNAEFTQFCNSYYGAAVSRPGYSYPPCPGQPGLVDLKGKTLPNAPRYQAGGGFDWTVPVGYGNLTLSAEAKWQSRVYFREFNNGDATMGNYALVNGTLMYAPKGERWSATIWGKNLTNKFVIANELTLAALYGYTNVGTLLPPRTYGATIDIKFR